MLRPLAACIVVLLVVWDADVKKIQANNGAPCSTNADCTWGGVCSPPVVPAISEYVLIGGPGGGPICNPLCNGLVRCTNVTAVYAHLVNDHLSLTKIEF